MCFSKKIKILVLCLSVLIGSMGYINYSYAASSNSSPSIPKPTTLPGPSTGNAAENENYLISNLIPTVAKGLLGLLGGGSLIFMIYGGVQYLMSFQNEENATNAKKTIQYALMGMLFGIFSYSIVNIVSYLDGLQGTQTPDDIIVCETGFHLEGKVCQKDK